MKNRILGTTFLLGLAFGLVAQPRQENLLLLTDRGHYMSGETIRYRSFYRKPAESGLADWSRVLYVELILPNGTPLAQGKVGLDSATAVGSIPIPEGLASGTYYLKAYTRWMRNCGTEGMAYTSVRIYDSFNESALPVDTAGWEPVTAGHSLSQAENYPSHLLDCQMEKSIFQTREEVEMKLDWTLDDVPLDVTVSVARPGLHGNQEYFGQLCQTTQSGDPSFLPEIRGLSLTGQAVGAGNGQPAPYASIYITMLGVHESLPPTPWIRSVHLHPAPRPYQAPLPVKTFSGP